MNYEPQVQLRNDRLAVVCPRWTAIAGLTHGTTTRAALPQPGKEDFFTNLERARAAGAIGRTLTFGADQVHGDHIAAIVEPIEDRKLPPGFRQEPGIEACEFPATDALITTLPGVILIIQTADCLPVFILDRKTPVAGLAHCGWRGLRQGLADKMAREIIAQGAGGADAGGARIAELEVWLGPCIRAARYEVGAALVEEFRGAFPGAPVSPDGTHLDMAAIARWQLEQAGIAPENIFDSGECTLGQPERYHSYRGQAGQAGRMFSFIGFGLED